MSSRCQRRDPRDLGSTRSVVTVTPTSSWGDTWATTEVFDYNPYGDLVSGYPAADSTTDRFAGKKRDDELNFDYFGARYYDPGPPPPSYVANPRWISAD